MICSWIIYKENRVMRSNSGGGGSDKYSGIEFYFVIHMLQVKGGGGGGACECGRAYGSVWGFNCFIKNV